MPFVFLNGKFINEEKAFISIKDHGFLYGDGVYETMRTYGDKIWQFEDHLDRLFGSLKLINLKIPWTKKQILKWTYQLIEKNVSFIKGDSEKSGNFFRIRLTITRGLNDFDFMNAKNPTILITAMLFKDEKQKKGLKIISYQGGRIAPHAKHLSQIINIMAKQEASLQKKDDAIFVDENGYIGEGAFSNVFMVKNGILKTPTLENVLSGTTRKFILSFAGKILSVKEGKIKLKDIYLADEIFLSVTSKRIIWVSEIDGHKIGNGKIGIFTKKIQENFNKKILEFDK